MSATQSTAGERKVLARYESAQGTRQLVGQRVNGTVHRDATIPEPAWRSRVNRTFPAGIDSGDRPAATAPAPPRDNWRGRSDVPRRVIDGIGGTRIYRGVDRYSAPPPRAEAPRPPARESSPPRAHESAPHRESGGSHSDGGKVHRDKS